MVNAVGNPGIREVLALSDNDLLVNAFTIYGVSPVNLVEQRTTSNFGDPIHHCHSPDL